MPFPDGMSFKNEFAHPVSCVMRIPALPPAIMEHEAAVFFGAHKVWEDFRQATVDLRLATLLADPTAFGSADFIAALSLLPEQERAPVVMGTLLQSSRYVSFAKAFGVCRALLAEYSSLEWSAICFAAMDPFPHPRELPVTLEEFPSRIWQRACRSNSQSQMQTAGRLALVAIQRVLNEYEEDQGRDDALEFTLPSGDLPGRFDLIGLAPKELHRLKVLLIEHIEREVMADRFELSEGQDTAIRAWIFPDDPNQAATIELMRVQAKDFVESLGGKAVLGSRYHLHRLGRFFFRLGLRRDAKYCARALGTLPCRSGWQHQVLAGSCHIRIRRHLLSSGSAAEAWKHEPALACSAMSVPLWIVDGKSRLDELMALFEKIHVFPWIFPRLAHIFQWHLAISGKQEALREIDRIEPDLSIGLGC